MIEKLKQESKYTISEDGVLTLFCSEVSFSNDDIIKVKSGIGLNIPKGAVAIVTPLDGHKYDMQILAGIGAFTGAVEEVVLTYRRTKVPTNFPAVGDEIATVVIVEQSNVCSRGAKVRDAVVEEFDYSSYQVSELDKVALGFKDDRSIARGVF